MALMFFFAVIVSGQPDSASVIRNPEAYAVYAAVLATRWPMPDVAATAQRTIALQAQTAAHPPCSEWPSSLDAGWRQALDSYSRENTTPRWLTPMADLGVRYTLVDSAEEERLLMEAQGDATKTYSPFWGGLRFSVSAAGFDRTGSRALVTLQYVRPATSQIGGRHFLLEKSGTDWKVNTSIAACEWGGAA